MRRLLLLHLSWMVFVGYRGSVDGRSTVTSSNGTFTLSGCKPGTNLLTAESPDFATTTIQIDTIRNSGPYQLSLQYGRPLLMRAVNQSGESILRASFQYDGAHDFRGPFSVQAEFNAFTDSEGHAVWENAPAGNLTFGVGARGYMSRDQLTLTTRGTENFLKIEANGYAPFVSRVIRPDEIEARFEARLSVK
ncbi:MAG TPA: carboxypeptidase-like regulatory domain-containing protein [Verrucomicrobiae bacterium]|jgi:hypothetical protein